MIPLLRAHSRIAFIDDELGYLDALRLTVPRRFAGSFHLTPASLDALLAVSREQLAAEQSRLQALAGPGPDTVGRALEYFADPARFDVVGVLVSDFAMPLENGISLCKRHGMPGLRRILLTGIADHRQVEGAFEHEAIEVYLPKHTPNLRSALAAALEAQLAESAARRGAVLATAGLPGPMAQRLAASDAPQALAALLGKHDVAEYLVLGAAQGMLCITEAGGALWVPMTDGESPAQPLGPEAAVHPIENLPANRLPLRFASWVAAQPPRRVAS